MTMSLVVTQPLTGAWAETERRLSALGRLEEDWDGAGAPPIPTGMIRSARRLAECLEARGDSPPESISPLSDGNIVLEWRFPDAVIQRIEVEGAGHGQMMTTAPGKWGFFGPFWTGKKSVGGSSLAILTVRCARPC